MQISEETPVRSISYQSAMQWDLTCIRVRRRIRRQKVLRLLWSASRYGNTDRIWVSPALWLNGERKAIRGAITARHMLHMTSGLYGEGNGSPQADIYAGGATVAGRAVTNMLDTLPGTRFLYNPPDTMLLMRAVREAVQDDRTFWAMPFQQFFWKIGMTRTTPASDWNGDFLMSGQTYSTARDFARFGLLYLNKGIWDGERILPEGWNEFVSAPGPVQPEGDGPRYGSQFWIYGGIDGLPAGAYSPSGGQGQYAMIIPSHGTVVVRRGFDAGSGFRIAKFCADILAAFD